jgi:hypothetical protein
VAAVLAALVGACDSGNTAVSPTPTGPTRVTENFSGTLVKGGTAVHSLSVGAGVVTTTLTALSPSTSTLIGMAYGLWDGTTCSPITPTAVSSNSMFVGASLVGTATTKISLCVKVYDVGNIPADTTYSYTIAVAHY